MHQKKSNENILPMETLPQDNSKRSVLNDDHKEEVINQLLQNLLNSITIQSELNRSFAKLEFCNGNTYSGWLGPTGFNGYGTFTYKNGDEYKGSFNSSLINGLGKYKFENGNTYEGEFLAGRKHGYGQYKTKDFEYFGNFKNGKFHGEGIWKSKTKELKGIFQEGKIIHGKLKDSNGVFEGKFDMSASKTEGKFTFTNGNTYNGSWSNNLFSGFGIYNWIKKDCRSTKIETKYIGFWSNGKRHGLGTQIFLHRCVSCQWIQDEKSGAGVIVSSNGNYYAGIELFINNQYTKAYRLRICKESRDILSSIFCLSNSNALEKSISERVTKYKNKITELLESYTEAVSPINPLRIPDYEIVKLNSPYDSALEIKCLQQVLTENYDEFMKLYKRYIHPQDECLNNLGLNIFYMDLLQKVQDVSIVKCMKDAQLKINSSSTNFDQKSDQYLMDPITFHEFFLNFVHITEVLMENEELKLTAEKLRPTFFGHLAIYVLLVLKMILTFEQPDFLVREAITINRPAILYLLKIMDEQSPGDETIRAAYKLLRIKNIVKDKSSYFIEAVEKYFENVSESGVLYEIDTEYSKLELIEIVLYTSQLKLMEEIKL